MSVVRVVLLCAALFGAAWLFVPMGINRASDPDKPRPMSASAEMEFRQRRQAMIIAANRLENSPCDQSLRPKLRSAIAAYIRARPDDYTPTLDEEGDIIAEATMAGIVQADDLFGPFGGAITRFAQKSQNNEVSKVDTTDGKFACHNGENPK